MPPAHLQDPHVIRDSEREVLTEASGNWLRGKG